MVSPENQHTINMIQTKQVVFMYASMYTHTHTYVHAHTCMYVKTINEKRDQKFERKEGGVYGRV